MQSFRDQSIDGTGLPLLTEDHLVNSLGMKLGPALKLRSILAKKLGGPCPCVACVAQAQQMLALQTGGAAAATGATAGAGTVTGAVAGAVAGAGATSATTSCSIKSEIFNGGSNGSSSGSSSNQGSDVAAPPAATASSPSSNMLLPVLPCSGLQDAS